jgi:hypothetical protein
LTTKREIEEFLSRRKLAIVSFQSHGANVIHGECILMFAEPLGTINRIHRWLWKILGKLPK